MGKIDLTFAPRLMGAPEAAAYLGLSPTTLRSLSIPRKVSGGRRLYDRLDLDAFASSLPYDGEQPAQVDEWDRAYGITR